MIQACDMMHDCKPMHVVICCVLQPSATSPLFFDNLHFEHFDKNVNHESIQDVRGAHWYTALEH